MAQQHPVLILKDISPNILEALLKFMYLGHVSIEDGKLADFISAAKSLKIKGLDVPGSQRSGDEEENVAIEQSGSSQESHASVTKENDSKEKSPSCQNHLLDSSLLENTTSLAVPGGGLISDGAPQNFSHARQGSGKARRGRPGSHSSKRLRSPRDSSPGFPPTKKSSQDLPSQPCPLPNPSATTAESQKDISCDATAPSLLNIPANPGCDAALVSYQSNGPNYCIINILLWRVVTFPFPTVIICIQYV